MFTTHAAPREALKGLTPFTCAPQIGDLVVAEVLELGQHIKLETRKGALLHLFPGDRIVGAFGNRYATDQYEGYIPKEVVEECDMLSIGGVFGIVASQHLKMNPPTRLGLHGSVCDHEGQPLNLRSFGLKPRSRFDAAKDAEVILVVGSSMNSGKTTTVGTLARALSSAGKRVAAAKVTGTAAGKDGRFFLSCGAHPVFDFTDAGFPSTYMLELDELMAIHHNLLGCLRAAQPEYILLEIADGIFQRETRMMLESEEFRRTIDHVFFSCADSLAAACGVQTLGEYGLPLRATTGAITQSELAIREAEEMTNFPCLNIERMVNGEVMELLRQAGSRYAESRVSVTPQVVPEELRRATGNLNGNSARQQRQYLGVA